MSTHAAEVEDWVPALTFPARLAVVRNRMGWNAKEAALACGLPQQSWRNWEAGKRPHDYELVCKKIHERTRCNLGWLMGSRPETSGIAPGTSATDGYPNGNRGFRSAAA